MKLRKEIWKEINGFSNYYISSYGYVISTAWGKSKILKPHITKGYYRITCSNIKVQHFTLHRLVAMYFIDNPCNKPCVNHIDGDKGNNHYSNLEWVTYSENERHSYDVLGKQARKGIDNVCSIQVGQYSINNILINTFGSIKEAERKTGIWDSGISACCRGKQKTAGNFIWKHII